MALTPGLIPFTEDRPETGGRQNGRMVVRDPSLDAPRLRPAAAPVETFNRPEQAPADDSTMQLAKALAGLNPSLTRFFDGEVRERQDDLPARIANRYAGKTPQETLALIKDDPDARSHLGGQLIAKYHARATASELGRQAQETYATNFDKDGGDLPGLLRGLRQQAMQQNGGNKWFAQEFDSAFNTIEQGLLNTHAKYRSERTNERVQETIQGGWVGTIDKGLAEGHTPDQVVAALRSSYDANKSVLSQSYPDQDKMLVGVLDTLKSRMEADPANAKKYLEVAKAIGQSDRVSTDGTRLGKLQDSTIGPHVTSKIAALESTFGGIQDRATVDAKHTFWIAADKGQLEEKALRTFFDNPDNKRAMTEQEYRGLLRQNENARQALAAEQNKVALEEQEKWQTNVVTSQALDMGDKQQLPWLDDVTIIDKNQKPKVVTAKEQREAAVTAMLEREKVVASRDTTPGAEERSFNRTVDWLTRNGETHPQWQDVLRKGAIAGQSVMQGDTIPPVMEQGFELYRRLAAKAPGLAHKMTDAESRDFYDVARVLTEYAGKDPQRALMTAVEYNKDPARFDSQTKRQTMDKVNDSLKNLRSNTFFMGGKLAGAENMEAVSVPMQKLAQVFVQAGGLNAETALKEAAKAVEQQFTVINGNAVNVGTREVPPNFKPLVEAQLRGFATLHGEKLGLDHHHLTIRPLTNQSNAWMIVDKATQLPVSYGPEAMITMDDLRKVADVKGEVARTRAGHKQFLWQMFKSNFADAPQGTFRDIARDKIGLPERSWATRPEGNK